MVSEVLVVPMSNALTFELVTFCRAAESISAIMALPVAAGTFETAAVEHARSAVVVGGLVSYSPFLHAVTRLHVRSVVSVGALDWYCDSVSHTLNALHTLSAEADGTAV